jgi:hypothetical protein
LVRIEDQCLRVGNLWKRGGMRACAVGGFYVKYRICEVFSVSILWHLQRFGMLVMHLWSEITLRSLRTNRLLYCPVVVWMFVRALFERACLRGLVGVRTLCVYLDLPLDASLPFWLHLICVCVYVHVFFPLKWNNLFFSFKKMTTIINVTFSKKFDISKVVCKCS